MGSSCPQVDECKYLEDSKSIFGRHFPYVRNSLNKRTYLKWNMDDLLIGLLGLELFGGKVV